MKVILCDERQEAREALQRQLLLVMEELSFSCTVSSCTGDRLLEENTEEEEILLIMGVQDSRGPELAHALWLRNPAVQVIWAVDDQEQIPKSDEPYVIGCFLYPLDRIRLCKLISHFQYLQAKRAGADIYHVRNSVGTVQMKIPYDKIEFAESQGNQILLHLTSGQVLRVYERMKNLEQELNDGRFLKCHQSYLINMEHVKSVGELFLMKSGAQVQIRQRDKKKLKEQYYRFAVESR